MFPSLLIFWKCLLVYLQYLVVNGSSIGSALNVVPVVSIVVCASCGERRACAAIKFKVNKVHGGVTARGKEEMNLTFFECRIHNTGSLCFRVFWHCFHMGLRLRVLTTRSPQGRRG